MHRTTLTAVAAALALLAIGLSDRPASAQSVRPQKAAGYRESEGQLARAYGVPPMAI